MARGNVYGQSSGGLKVNDVEKTTAVIKIGSVVSEGDLISYDGSEVTKRGIGNNINSGNEFVFTSSSTVYISAVSLTSTKVLVSYRDNDNNYYGTSIVLNISEDIITSGSAYIFNSSDTGFISAVSLTSTKVLVSYQDGGNSQYGTAIVLNINGINITKGSEFVFNSGADYINAVSLTDTKVLISYRDYGNNFYCTSIVLNISGNIISKGSPYVFSNSTNTEYISATSLTDTKVLVSYNDSSNSYYGTSIVLNISGTNITKGSPYVFNNIGSTYYISAVSLSDTKVFVSYQNKGNSYYGTSIVLNINGTNITGGSPYVFNSGNRTDYINAISLSDTTVLVSYKDNSSYGTSIVLNIDGNNISKGSEYIFNSGYTQYISIVSLTDTKVLVSYQDTGNNSYGTSIVLNLNKLEPEGIALKSGTGGETIDIYKF